MHNGQHSFIDTLGVQGFGKSSITQFVSFSTQLNSKSDDGILTIRRGLQKLLLVVIGQHLIFAYMMRTSSAEAGQPSMAYSC